MEELKDHTNHELNEECNEFIRDMRESRCNNTLIRHLNKFNQLCHQTRSGYSNHTGGHPKNTYTLAPAPIITAPPTVRTLQMEKWVKNLSGVPLTMAQVSLLAHGPNFAAAPRHPPYVEYIAAWSMPARALSHMKQKSIEQKSGDPQTLTHPQSEHHQGRSPDTCRFEKRPVKNHTYNW